MALRTLRKAPQTLTLRRLLGMDPTTVRSDATLEGTSEMSWNEYKRAAEVLDKRDSRPY